MLGDVTVELALRGHLTKAGADLSLGWRRLGLNFWSCRRAWAALLQLHTTSCGCGEVLLQPQP